MSDGILRDLERQAANGDLSAREKLLNALKRSRRLDYRLMDEADTYAKGKCALQRTNSLVHPTVEIEGRQVIRPLTFRESLEARVYQYQNASEEERLALFKTWNDTCTGILYKGGTNKFKIIPVSFDLIGLEESFNESFFSVSFENEQFSGLEELDSSKGIYDQLLSQGQVLKHPAWLAAVEQDKHLLEEYASIVFTELKKQYSRNKAMSFWVRREPPQDQLRALFVLNLICGANAGGDNNLDYDGRFVKVTSIQPSESEPKIKEEGIE